MTARACPSCRRAWPGDREVCPRCLAALVVDVDATITCRSCGRSCPARMQSCPGCFAVLRPEDVDLGPALERALATGTPMPRAVGREAFADGPGCTVRRLASRSGLVLVGTDGFVEATVDGRGIAARVPLTCFDEGRVRFRLVPYAAASKAVVAVASDGASLATFLASGRRIDVRDETSAPVARIERSVDGIGFAVVETGGAAIGALDRDDVELDDWIDDRWTVTPGDGWRGGPLRPLAWVALAVAAKVLWGRPEPVPAPERAEPVLAELE